MIFPTTGSGRPYVRINGHTGTFALSTPDGEPKAFQMNGKLLDIDLNGASQGWLRLDSNGADWVPLAGRDAWRSTPSPSSDHDPGVRVDMRCPD